MSFNLKVSKVYTAFSVLLLNLLLSTIARIKNTIATPKSINPIERISLLKGIVTCLISIIEASCIFIVTSLLFKILFIPLFPAAIAVPPIILNNDAKV